MSEKVKQPLKQGTAKVPVIMQLEMLECGAACLAMILAYYEKWIPLEQVRVDCGVSRDGSNAKNILIAARNYGMTTKAYRMEPAMLQKEGSYPCILHWGFNHFVVLDGFRGNKAVINDPGRGRIIVPWEEFDRQFTGIVLMFEPGEQFVPSGKKKTVMEYTKDQLQGTSKAVLFVLLTTLIGAMLGVIEPVFRMIFTDRLLTGRNIGWFYPFILTLILFAGIRILVSWLSAVYSLRIKGKMAVVGKASFLWKVLRLPMPFFSQRMPGDIAARQETNAQISGVIVDTFAPLLVQIGMLLFYLIVMVRYSPLLTLIGVGAILINTLVSWKITDMRTNIARVQQRDQGKLSGTTVAGISMIETIKASGAENGYFGKWAGYQASVNTQKTKYVKINQMLGNIPELITALANLAVLGGGAYLVLQGRFTVGMLMAFQGFLGSFMEPAGSLVSAGSSLQQITTQIEQVDDVMNYPQDPCFEREVQTEDYKKLTGQIELRDVSFGYSRLGAPLIEHFSMTVKAGEKVAFVGESGCGKSTLAKLISGLYQPWEGEILFDGKPIDSIDHHVFTGSVAVVDQDITLFDDTISENIRMWDSSIEGFEVIMAARDAGLHEDIMYKSGGYEHKLLEGGKDLSGGQKQRLEIARALAQDPTICILDEATSALDAKTEYQVVRSITDRGITCVVVAHRLSTIRDCDEIIVMDQGKVVERGTHEQLLALGGKYTQLITSE